jgi:hypothetical protein
MDKPSKNISETNISNIPMAKEENSLVIDLPDGQKLIVGDIPLGTVIEVATWRGTGRPDSRTNRLMLGVSNSDQIKALENQQQNDVKVKVGNNKISFYLNIVGKFAIKIFGSLKSLILWVVTFDKNENRALSEEEKGNSYLSSKHRFFRSKSNKDAQQKDDVELSDETSEWLKSLLEDSPTSRKDDVVKQYTPRVPREPKKKTAVRKAAVSKPKKAVRKGK